MNDVADFIIYVGVLKIAAIVFSFLEAFRRQIAEPMKPGYTLINCGAIEGVKNKGTVHKPIDLGFALLGGNIVVMNHRGHITAIM